MMKTMRNICMVPSLAQPPVSGNAATAAGSVASAHFRQWPSDSTLLPLRPNPDCSERRPLRAITQAAGQIGAGGRPAPIEPSGPEELRAVARAINSMNRDLAQLDQNYDLIHVDFLVLYCLLPIVYCLLT